LICTDVLGNAARFTSGYIRLVKRAALPSTSVHIKWKRRAD